MAYHFLMMLENTFPDSLYKAAICELGIKNQQLMSRALDLGLITEAKQLRRIDQQLFYLLKQTRQAFDFVGHIAGGNVLLVGEGNLSFALNPSILSLVVGSLMKRSHYMKRAVIT